MVTAFLLSLIPLFFIVRTHKAFSLHSAYFIFNWLVISASVLVSSLVNADLVELGTVAEANYAAAAYNLALALTLYCSAITYRKLQTIELTVRRIGVMRLERSALIWFILLCCVVATHALLPSPPLLSGTPVSEFFATLNAIQRFAFVSLAIAALPLSSLVRSAYLKGHCRPLAAAAFSLTPAMLWVLAGEKMGYLLFVLFCTALPWLQGAKDLRRLQTLVVVAVLVSLSLTLIQYTFNAEDPLLMLGARAAMQGQLWYHFYEETPALQPLSSGLQFLLGLNGAETIRAMMEMAMPVQLYLNYETAAMTGSHIPALLHATGWLMFPAALAACGVLFGVATTLVRLAVQAQSPWLSYLIIAAFVFPGVEVWIAGNFSRIVAPPPTFLVLTALCLALLVNRLSVRIKRQSARLNPTLG
jgi:hypothetical protein